MKAAGYWIKASEFPNESAVYDFHWRSVETKKPITADDAYFIMRKNYPHLLNTIEFLHESTPSASTENKLLSALLQDWNDVNVVLPQISMKVRWITKDGTRDVGYYNSDKKQFLTMDVRSFEEIIYWKPLHP